MEFAEKNLTAYFIQSDFTNIKIKKLVECPFCGYGTDSPPVEKGLYQHDKNKNLMILSHKCNHCNKIFNSFYSIDTNSKTARYESAVPTVTSKPYENERINSISPRFIDMYNQALRADFNGDIELAAFGMRAALEILIKDYAIVVLGKPEEEVTKASLFNCIGDYLNSPDLLSAADVVRILGNDYAHSEKKHPEYNYEVLKDYMDIFISLIDVNLKLKNPPVSRN